MKVRNTILTENLEFVVACEPTLTKNYKVRLEVLFLAKN